MHFNNYMLFLFNIVKAHDPLGDKHFIGVEDINLGKTWCSTARELQVYWEIKINQEAMRCVKCYCRRYI